MKAWGTCVHGGSRSVLSLFKEHKALALDGRRSVPGLSLTTHVLSHELEILSNFTEPISS